MFRSSVLAGAEEKENVWICGGGEELKLSRLSKQPNANHPQIIAKHYTNADNRALRDHCNS